MPRKVQRKKSRSRPLSVEGATTKLLETSNTIQCREGVRLTECKRIREAFQLLGESGRPADKKTTRRGHFRNFLTRVKKVAGLEMVVLCTVGLGQSTVGNMKDRLRLDLPLAIKNRDRVLTCSVLRDLVEEYSTDVSTQTGLASPLKFDHKVDQRSANPMLQAAQPQEIVPTQSPELPQVTTSLEQVQIHEPGPTVPAQPWRFEGAVFELTVEDAQAIAVSNQIKGDVWLTHPYGMDSNPFISIPISRELSIHFTKQRPRMM